MNADVKPDTNWLKANRGFLVFLLCFGLLRTAIADWNPVPSASMRPSILEGDVVLVNRLAYDAKLPLSEISLARLGEPQRGDIVTFAAPTTGVLLIKRLVALPGDTVELRDGRLLINGEAAHYSAAEAALETLGPYRVLAATRSTETVAGSSRRVQHLSGLNAAGQFGPLRVPAEHYFMLGDNRDNSVDSRFIGAVPRRLLVGRAHHILLSADITDRWQPRWERVAAALR